jgi:hypothetical protein
VLDAHVPAITLLNLQGKSCIPAFAGMTKKLHRRQRRSDERTAARVAASKGT